MTPSRIRKFHETDGDGRRLTRIVYVMDPASLPSPHPGTEWTEDPRFDEAQELRANSTLRIVFEEAHAHGFAVVE
jgi:hypothetical protein